MRSGFATSPGSRTTPPEDWLFDFLCSDFLRRRADPIGCINSTEDRQFIEQFIASNMMNTVRARTNDASKAAQLPTIDAERELLARYEMWPHPEYGGKWAYYVQQRVFNEYVLREKSSSPGGALGR